MSKYTFDPARPYSEESQRALLEMENFKFHEASRRRAARFRAEDLPRGPANGQTEANVQDGWSRAFAKAGVTLRR